MKSYLITFAVFFSTAVPVLSDAAEVTVNLALCVKDADSQDRAAIRLSRWLHNIEVTLVEGENCASDNAAPYVGWFAQAPGRLWFVMRRAYGPALRRNIPWLKTKDDPLNRLNTLKKLSAFSVVIQGLFVEHGLDDSVFRQGMPDQPLLKGNVVSGGSVSVKDPTLVETTTKKKKEVLVPPYDELDERRAQIRARLLAQRRAKLEALDTGPSLWSRHMPRNFTEAFLAGVAIEVHFSARYRSSLFFSAGADFCVRWYSVFFRVGYQPEARWNFDGRAMEVASVPLGLGLRPTLWRRNGWRLEGLAAVLVERLQAKRLDVVGAQPHTFWDIGAALGAGVTRRVAGGLEIGLLVEGAWYPGAHTLQIPQGPSAQISKLAIQSSIFVAWGPSDDR